MICDLRLRVSLPYVFASGQRHQFHFELGQPPVYVPLCLGVLVAKTAHFVQLFSNCELNVNNFRILVLKNQRFMQNERSQSRKVLLC